jgi:hypothetical protein
VGAARRRVVGADLHDPPVQPVRQCHVGDRRDRLGRRYPAAGDDPAEALVARYCLQPLTEPGGLPQPVQLCPRDDKGVLDDVGGSGLWQDAPAVGEQGSRVRVERLGEPGRVASHDRRDDL